MRTASIALVALALALLPSRGAEAAISTPAIRTAQAQRVQQRAEQQRVEALTARAKIESRRLKVVAKDARRLLTDLSGMGNLFARTATATDRENVATVVKYLKLSGREQPLYLPSTPGYEAAFISPNGKIYFHEKSAVRSIFWNSGRGYTADGIRKSLQAMADAVRSGKDLP